jgi:ubiquinone/menaquinone biosynthesis C-methylase UbiE
MVRTIKLISSSTKKTQPEEFWSQYTVNETNFTSIKQSLHYLDWRFKEYNQAKEFMEMYGIHDNEIILDYGCGPGNDLVGFSVYSKAKKIIGCDVSIKALTLANRRLDLHKIPESRVELIHVSDERPNIPVPDNYIDFIHCGGTLQHTLYPDKIIKEFYRILKNSGRCNVMVYNYDSIWLHLYVAYVKIIKEKKFRKLNIRQAFSKCVDTKRCPIARCYKSEEFIQICSSGFNVEYIGGYLANREMTALKDYKDIAIKDPLFQGEHRNFITNLKFDSKGFPIYKEKYAGYGGVYHLTKRG